MIELKVNSKTVPLHWGPLCAEWLWLDTCEGKVTSARSDWVPLSLFYAHKNWSRINGDALRVTLAELYTWFEGADEIEYLPALTEYEESKAKERWEKIVSEMNDAIEKKMLGVTPGDTVTAL